MAETAVLQPEAQTFTSPPTPEVTTTVTIVVDTTKKPKVLESFPYTCPLCLEEFAERKQLYRVVGCRHLYCRECMVQYYIQNVNERKVKVKCPDPTCTEELHFRNMKDIIDYKYILKFQRFSLADNPPPEDTKNRHIWCPGIECKTKIIKNKVNVARAFEDSEVKCPKCLLVVCFKCGEWSHTGYPCNEAEGLTDKKLASEVAQKPMFDEWMKDKATLIKPCPKCGAMIEKTGGCSHMNCKRCSYQWCWVCLKHCTSTHCYSS